MILSIILGFAMATLGVAMLCVGEVPFVAGRRIPARRSRLIGGVLVGFLPLAFVANQLFAALLGPEGTNGAVVVWSVFSLCWVAVTILLFRVLLPKQERRPRSTVAESPPVFAEPDLAPALEEPKKPAAKRTPAPKRPAPHRPAPREDNPFDFS